RAADPATTSARTRCTMLYSLAYGRREERPDGEGDLHRHETLSFHDHVAIREDVLGRAAFSEQAQVGPHRHLDDDIRIRLDLLRRRAERDVEREAVRRRSLAVVEVGDRELEDA